MYILRPYSFYTRTHLLPPLCASVPAAHMQAMPLRLKTCSAECLLTGSFSPDGLNDFITINDRDRGSPRRVARCSGTAEVPLLFSSHPAASSHPSFCAV